MSTSYKALESALDIVSEDIAKIKKLSEAAETLDRAEANKLTDYIKALLSVHKEEREELKAMSLQTKGVEDLEDLAKEALDFLGLTPDEEEPEDKETDDESTDKLPPNDTEG